MDLTDNFKILAQTDSDNIGTTDNMMQESPIDRKEYEVLKNCTNDLHKK
jgi:hypothetical protein